MMAHGVVALTRPSTFYKVDLIPGETVPIQWGCIVACVRLDYAADGAGADREVAILVKDPAGRPVALVPAPLLVTPGATVIYYFMLGADTSQDLVMGAYYFGLPTIPMWEGYTLEIAQTGAAVPADDTIKITLHLMK